ncbi:thiol-disulfide oxidoreductase DCC family protein [Kushneria sp. TE3]|uniref:thiol-disulfide oxidoreductase DCC family protein n=1 Tax=Kushneria sp. TE3 TaxID=3449832 RepID=UPI003F682465
MNSAPSTTKDSTTADGTAGSHHDAPPTDPDWPGQLVVFDGDCPLCRRSVHAIVAHEAQPITGLVTLQSSLGHQLGAHFDEDADDLDSMWLIRDGALFRDSDGLWRTAQSLKAPWSAAAGLRWLPVPLRDGAYQLVGRYRKQLASDPGLDGVQDRILTTLTPAQCSHLSLPTTLADD